MAHDDNSDTPPHDLAVFEGSRRRLGAIAYRMLGDASAAEDVVQETYLRWAAADRIQITNSQAWLTRVAMNLCLDLLGSARARREFSSGQWLPEPLLEEDPLQGPESTTLQRDSLTTAFLLLLEELTPRDRAVCVLREGFGFSHRDVAEIIGTTEQASRQAQARARRTLEQRRDTGDHPDRASTTEDLLAARERSMRLVEEFVAAAAGGDLNGLIALLDPGARGVGDGGKNVPARPTVVRGASAVATWLRGVFASSSAKLILVGGHVHLRFAVINGDPGIVAANDERVVGVITLHAVGGRIQTVHLQADSDKLHRFQRTWSDLTAADPQRFPVVGTW